MLLQGNYRCKWLQGTTLLLKWITSPSRWRKKPYYWMVEIFANVAIFPPPRVQRSQLLNLPDNRRIKCWDGNANKPKDSHWRIKTWVNHSRNQSGSVTMHLSTCIAVLGGNGTVGPFGLRHRQQKTAQFVNQDDGYGSWQMIRPIRGLAAEQNHTDPSPNAA